MLLLLSLRRACNSSTWATHSSWTSPVDFYYLDITVASLDKFLEHIETIHSRQREQNCRYNSSKTALSFVVVCVVLCYTCWETTTSVPNGTDWLNLFANSVACFRATRTVETTATITTTSSTATNTISVQQTITMLVNLNRQSDSRIMVWAFMERLAWNNNR